MFGFLPVRACELRQLRRRRRVLIGARNGGLQVLGHRYRARQGRGLRQRDRGRSQDSGDKHERPRSRLNR